ncbi:MAG: hypothetical protein A3J28_18690 [Acidobacteria bacterium RIFCSPLOWO2_12_FULL_60_22]|nr:MAG: hypothetical protein A3J28_18690 [Acidobacteria bacterium RIFCSPLOWO2_12_FULL_60_22]
MSLDYSLSIKHVTGVVRIIRKKWSTFLSDHRKRPYTHRSAMYVVNFWTAQQFSDFGRLIVPDNATQSKSCKLGKSRKPIDIFQGAQLNLAGFLDLDRKLLVSKSSNVVACV